MNIKGLIKELSGPRRSCDSRVMSSANLGYLLRRLEISLVLRTVTHLHRAIMYLQETLQTKLEGIERKSPGSFHSSSQSCSDDLLEPLLRSDVLPEATGSPASGTPSLLYRLRRLDLLDLLLLGPTPPAVYWRCRLKYFSSSSYRTRLLGLGGPGDLDSRFGETSDLVGERPSGLGRPAQ